MGFAVNAMTIFFMYISRSKLIEKIYKMYKIRCIQAIPVVKYFYKNYSNYYESVELRESRGESDAFIVELIFN